jgi:hypothetical protein
MWFKEENRRSGLLTAIRQGTFRSYEMEPAFKELVADVLKETHRQRAKVIEYLKEEGDWDPAWDKELGLNSQ